MDEDPRGIFIHRLARGLVRQGEEATVLAPGVPARERRTLQSSFDSTRQGFAQRVMAPAVEALVYPFHVAQLAFRTTDLGDGHVVVCRAG